MSTIISSILDLPNDLIDKIYEISYKNNMQEVHCELKNVRKTYAGDFSEHPDEFMQSEGEIAYKIINEMDAWDIVKQSESYMFNYNQILNEIMTKIDQQSTCGHSGASIGFLMQHMRYIAVHGWNNYYKKFIELS